jgi:integrase
MMHQLEAEASKGRLGGTTATLNVLLNRYLEHLERKGLSPKTLHTYRKYVDTTIRAALGRRPVQRLTAWDLDTLYATMTEAGKSASTIRQHHAILSGALGQAVKWGWCPLNVATMASPPIVHQPRIDPPSPEEVRAIVELAEQRNPILAALIMLAALTGARRGEAMRAQMGAKSTSTPAPCASPAPFSIYLVGSKRSPPRGIRSALSRWGKPASCCFASIETSVPSGPRRGT